MSETTDYKLQSAVTGQVYEDTGWLLEAPGEEKPGLIRAVYAKKQLQVKDDRYGLYRFADWLPICRFLKGSSAPVTYKSQGLARTLGLENLYITFSGYWPEKGAMMRTCSFKETEAYSVCARLDNTREKVLVVASAGNTARSFARVCSDNDIPLLLCVPEDNIDVLWFDEPVRENVRLIVSRSGGDYYDAIHLSNIACKHPRFIAEGGAKNVARRDGMGTTVLSAVATLGRIPGYYFQAVGSGTGAIAAWEANLRLIEDARFGRNKMKLMVSQNFPFTPMYDAWKAGTRSLLPMDDDVARRQVEIILDRVLSNRRPPYSIAGGLYDALVDSGGDIMVATNEEALAAGKLFEETEGIDLHPAAAVATASLVQAVKNKRVDPRSVIMLNITGGGEERFKKEHELHYLKPSLVFDIDPDEGEVLRGIEGLFG
ncbi:MAG: cysteate synthase [Lentimicrobiaceae bacterium]|nr:cysteate synthase [Lentimicrobiaceae bacterium]